jgi:uncharacterized membrane protein YeaQ/YmgE (transglycosylase-associated protein family)
MDLTSLLIFLAVGAVAGWLAGLIVKGGGFGLLWNIILGIIGGIVGGWLFGVLGISAGSGLVGSIITAVVGAVVIVLWRGFSSDDATVGLPQPDSD